MLDELIKLATSSSDVPLIPLKNRTPFVFAICSEGIASWLRKSHDVRDVEGVERVWRQIIAMGDTKAFATTDQV